RVLMPLPEHDFDPTEAAVPWNQLKNAGHEILFATPRGKKGIADPRMLTGKGLGPLAPMLMANPTARKAFHQLSSDPRFERPLPYWELRVEHFDGILLPGGHASGVRAYLDSELLQELVG